MQRWLERAKTIYHETSSLDVRWLAVIRHSVTRFAEMRGPEVAASLAYYALFSLFPLILAMAALMGMLFGGEGAYLQIVSFIRGLIPFSGDLLERNLAEVIEKRGTIGLISVVAALWAATGFFTTLARNVNRAWPMVKLRGAVHNRLVGFGMVAALFMLLFISLVSTTVVHFFPLVLRRFGLSLPELHAPTWLPIIQILSIFFSFLLFVGLYRWVPNKDVRWKAVLIGSVAVTIVWELAKQVFTFYLRSGFARYEILYGSLGTLIALMVWIYVSNLIVLFGAFLVASIDLREEQLAGPVTKPAPAAQAAPLEHKPEGAPVKGVRG